MPEFNYIPITESIRIYPAKEIETLLLNSMEQYIKAVNETISYALTGADINKFSSKDIKAELPSAVRAQIARDSRSVLKKYRKDCHNAVLYNRKYPDKIKAVSLPVLKIPVCYWNNQNYKICENSLSLPVWIYGKSERISVRIIVTKHQASLLQNKLGALRLVKKQGHLFAQIVINVPMPDSKESSESTMGIDLGLKVPAVCYTDTGNIHFSGNGRKNKYLKRFYRYQRKKLQKLKKPKVIKRIEHKESRVFRDIDHKISRDIICFAVKKHVTTIKMERLTNIRATARTSRKNEKNLHTWSFYQLQKYIEYKAALAGIKVIYVNPKNTSKLCPVCRKKNTASDRRYRCSCGFIKHRDIVGAMNICKS